MLLSAFSMQYLHSTLQARCLLWLHESLQPHNVTQHTVLPAPLKGLLFPVVSGDSSLCVSRHRLRGYSMKKEDQKKENHFTLEGPAASSQMTKLESSYVTSCLR